MSDLPTLRELRWFLIGIPSLLVLIQFLGPEKTNPSVDPDREIVNLYSVPPSVEAILRRSCFNCHSHETVWPWYSNVAPVSWFVIDHVNFGRDHMNLSDWAHYDREETDELFEEMCVLVREREMPLPPYLWMHKEARLGDQAVEMLCQWTEELRNRGEARAIDK